MNYLYALLAVTLVAANSIGAQTADAQEANGQPPATSTLKTDTLTVRGRFVDADTGKPIKHCRARLTGHQSTGYNLAWAAADWANPPELTTGEDGVFRFELRVPASKEERNRDRYHLNVSHSHHCAWFSHCLFETGQRLGGIDYGDIRLPKGVRPRVRCVDTNGKLQAGVTIQLARLERDRALITTPTYGAHSWVEQGAYERTDIDGYLHLDAPIPRGDYKVVVTGRDVRQVPEKLAVPSTEALEVIVEALPINQTIAGRLVDEDGAPVANALLAVESGRRKTRGVTRRDGYFTLFRAEPAKDTFAVISMARNRRYDNWVQLGAVQWGTDDAELVVPSLARATFVVKNEQGVAIPDFNLYCLPIHQQARRAGVRVAGTFREGRAACRLAPGEYQLLVTPRTNQWLPSAWETITVEPGEQEHIIQLAAPTQRTVTVSITEDQGHAPATNVLVEVIVGEQPGPFEFVRPITAAVDPSLGEGTQVVASAMSDEQGKAKLMLSDPGRAHLRVSGINVQTQVVSADLSDAKQLLRIEVERGGTISGQLGPLDNLRQLDPGHDPGRAPSIYNNHSWSQPTLTLTYDHGRQQREGVRLDHEGRFACQGLPPGDVEVQLRVREKVNERSHRLDPTPYLLGKFTIDVRKPLNVKLDVPNELRAKDKR